MTENIRIHNKIDKPKNIVLKENEAIERALEIQRLFPSFMMDYCIYLKGSIAINSRLAYLEDILFFFKYMITEDVNLTEAKTVNDIAIEDLDKIKARDINYYIGEYCSRYYRENNSGSKIIYENHNRALARKKSSLNSLFKFLYRNEQITNNITDGFNPIKLPKPQPEAIKKLAVEEVSELLKVVETGNGLTEKELDYWKKTRQRDKAIVTLFVTYGLRLSELQQLNISSFNFNRNEFQIYRKRGKEATMPLNETCKHSIVEYLNGERSGLEFSEGEADALFLSLQGKRITARAIRELVKKYTAIVMGTSKKSGYSPHKLRATAASSLIEFGFSIYDVQNLLDHDNVTTTQLYASHKKNVKKDIVDNFEWDENKDSK